MFPGMGTGKKGLRVVLTLEDYRIAYGGTDLDGHVTGHENYQSDTDSDLRADHTGSCLVSPFGDGWRSTG